MLHRGFTTVRDAAGADFGLQEAVARGLFDGPRRFIAGQPISQTSGHADMRPKGVRSIEHGHLIDEATAREMKRCGAFLVPTLATCSAEMLDKLARVQSRGLDAVRIALAEGVPVVFGTDLLGHMHGQQSQESVLRSAAMGPLQVLRSSLPA